MALIVETGSIVDGATSYVSLEDARAYAAARGVTLPADDAEAEAIIIKAMDFLESYADRFKGERVERDQPLSWPRVGAVIEGWPWGPHEIPRQVVSAQLALIVEINGGADPFNPPADLPVVRERVEGAVEVEYANPGKVYKVAADAPSRTIINTLLKHSGLMLIRA